MVTFTKETILNNSGERSWACHFVCITMYVFSVQELSAGIFNEQFLYMLYKPTRSSINIPDVS